MYYFEDLAYDVKTPKFIKIRNIVVIIVGVIIFIQAFLIYVGNVSQKKAVQDNAIAIADYQQQYNSVKSDIEKLQSGDTRELYNSWESGIKVAELQSAYGNIPINSTVDTITESARETASNLDKFISDPFGRTPWYNNAAYQYTWSYLTRQTSVVEEIPCMWICRSDKSNIILAVTTGKYNGFGELFGDFNVYYTTKGNALLEDDVMLVNGNIVSSVDYIDYYKNVEEVMSEIAENETLPESESPADGETESESEQSTEESESVTEEESAEDESEEQEKTSADDEQNDEKEEQ